MSVSYDCADTEQRRDGLVAAASAVRSGQLVVLPTDTVYGVGCDAFSATAVRGLLDAKGRGPDMPVPVLVGSWSTIDGLVTSVPTAARELVEAFWPGGLSLVLLEMAGRLDRESLAARLRYWLSAATDAQDNARLIAGLFALHRGTLVRDRALIGAVTDFLLELEVEQLVPLLPVLRRSLGDLSSAERAYLGETLAALLNLHAARAGRALAITSQDEPLLREADRAVAATLASWETHYGIRP